MAYSPEDAEGYEDEAVDAYLAAEDALIAALVAAATRTGRAPNWQHAATMELQRQMPAVLRVARGLDRDVPAIVNRATAAAYRQGRAQGEAETQAARRAGHLPPKTIRTPPELDSVIPEADRTVTVGRPDATPIKLRPPLPQVPGGTTIGQDAANAAAKRAKDAARVVHQQIPRNVRSVWDDIIRRASEKVQAGELTVQQALQQAMDDAAKEGFGFYRDAAGRKWGLDTYSEMAIRTTTNQALRAGHAQSLVDAGLDLVIVDAHANPAPVCAPFERRVLSLTGAYRPGTQRVDNTIVNVAATMDEAVSAGFQHPNCRHSIAAYLPGFTDTTPPPPDPDHEGYRATQKQRRLEREIRKSRRMEQAALADDAKRAASERKRAYEKKLREHIKEHDLPRRRHREQIRKPGNPMPPA